MRNERSVTEVFDLTWLALLQ